MRLSTGNIKIYRRINTGTNFAPVWSWALVFDVQGVLDRLSGNKIIRNEGGAIITDAVCYIDFMPVLVSDRIVDGSDVYDVVFIRDPNQMNHHIEIDCKYQPAGTLTQMGLGDLTGQRLIQMVTVSASAVAGQNFTALYTMDIKIVMVDCTANVVGGTLKLRTTTNDITSELDCAVSGDIDFTEVISVTYKRLTAGKIYNIISGSTAERGIVYIIGEPV